MMDHLNQRSFRAANSCRARILASFASLAHCVSSSIIRYRCGILLVIETLGTRRGILTIAENKTRKESFFGEREKTEYVLELNRDALEKKADTVQPFEKEVLNFLFEELGAGGNLVGKNKCPRFV